MEFERPAVDFSEAIGFPDICIRKVSERVDDITVVVQSCELEPDTNLQFDCEFSSNYIQFCNLYIFKSYISCKCISTDM